MEYNNISRRSVSKGFAWTVPAVAAAGTAPALAASPVSTVVGNSWFFSKGTSTSRVDGLVQSGENEACSYYVNNAPASVSDLSITYWLPSASYVFTAASGTLWSPLKRDSSQPNKVGPNTGATYYAYTTTYAGTGDSSTTCGPSYSFTAPSVPGNGITPNDAYYYQLSYLLNGTARINPLQMVKNP